MSYHHGTSRCTYEESAKIPGLYHHPYHGLCPRVVRVKTLRCYAASFLS
jgi:hypothetical protein